MALSVTLHLGAHRTGTSALQQALAQRRAKLEAAGMAFWGPGIMRRLLGHEVLRHAVEGQTDRAAGDEFGRVAGQVRERAQADERAGARDLLISEENLLGTMAANLWQTRLYPHVVARLTAFLRLLPEPPKALFLSVRDYAGYWASSFGFAALRNDLPPFGDLRAGLLANDRGWDDVVADIRSVCPEIPLFVWPFRAEPTGVSGLIERMIGAARVQKAGIVVRQRNRGLSGAALEHGLALRRAEPGLDPQELVKRAREASAAGPAFMPFSDAEKRLLTERYDADLARIAARPGIAMLGVPG